MILKSKIAKINKRQGRNNRGIITIRHRGGGAKKRVRIIKCPRTLKNIKGIVNSFEYNPNSNTYLAVIFYETGNKEYIIKPKSLQIGDIVSYNSKKENLCSIGSSAELNNIRTGSKVYSLEFKPFSKKKLASAGESAATILTKHSRDAIILLPSKEIRLFSLKCIAYIGIPELFKKSKANKAGRSRHLGIRPTVRGTAMNAVDHPHGGGEGKSPIGRKFPLTPWGKHTLGAKTRKKKGNSLILRRHNK